VNIESKLWKLVSANTSYVMVVQKASQQMRMVSRGKLPSTDELAAMHETKFDSVARSAFHGWEEDR
jgi:hypothetical protein